MTSRDERVFLEDILTSAKLAMSYVEGLTQEEFAANVEKQDAVVRRLEVISEAGANLSDETRRSFADVPWTKVKGMRNLMVHRYWGVDPALVWAVVQNELPRLVREIQRKLP